MYAMVISRLRDATYHFVSYTICTPQLCASVSVRIMVQTSTKSGFHKSKILAQSLALKKYKEETDKCVNKIPFIDFITITIIVVNTTKQIYTIGIFYKHASGND